MGQTKMMLIEDFGTKGLEGSIEDKRANGSFAKFWWRTGDSNKDAGSNRGGRHGVGKVVNTDASMVGAFFGYSVSGEVLRSTLLGRSSLKLHVFEHESGEYQPEGTFYKKLPGMGIAPTPFMGEEADAFATAANLKRKPTERGLSIAVLWPKEEFSPQSIREACLQECLYQIAAEELDVEIDGEVLTENTLREELEKLAIANPKLAHLRASYDLIQSALTTPASNLITPAAPIDPKDGRLSNATFSAEQIEKMRLDWVEGRPIIMSVKIVMRRKGDASKDGQLMLALQKAREGETGWATCVRDDVTVPDAVRWSRPAIALMVAKNNPLAGFLGDAEGPSHENWFNEYVKESYSYSSQTIAVVKGALNRLYDVLMGAEEEDVVEGALKPYFTVHEVIEKQEDEIPPDNDDDEMEQPEATPTPIKLRRIKNGFKATLTEDGEKIAPFDLRVRAAYRVRMSDPFRAYSPEDFAFNQSGLTYECEGADLKEANDNEIVIKGIRKGFSLSATGFDGNREVAVKWEIDNGTASEEA